jgi:two-component sensor histidine kinase
MPESKRQTIHPTQARAGAPASGAPRRTLGRRVLVPACFFWWFLAACPGICAPEQPPGGNVFVDDPSSAQFGTDSVLDSNWGVGSWIWMQETHDKQTCRFWRSFEIPRGAKVEKAQIHIGVDNGYLLMLDGRELGTGSDWRCITEYDVSLLLEPGRHVLAVQAFNDNREAGMLFGMIVKLTDGRVIRIPSDTNWRIPPAGENGWERKHVAPAHWRNSVVLSPFLPRDGFWHERKPTMTVKVPVLRPLETHFWQSGWFQATLWISVCITVLMYLRVLAKFTVQSKAQAMLHTERARIARDIHDELGARLTELALEGEVVQTELPAGSPARPGLEALCEKARAVSGAMDELVWMVNSRRDTLRDFANFACRHAQRFLSQTQIRCRLDVDPDLPEMPFELPVRRNLLLGVKEALNNAVKYSHASEVLLSIHRRGQTLLVVIEDNGGGFDPEKADASRNGLTNMLERMKEVGGMCRINARPGAGCRVEFQVPLPKHPRRSRESNPADAMTLAAIHSMPQVPAVDRNIPPS